MGGLLTALGGFTPEALRVAWLVQYPVWAVAVAGVIVTLPATPAASSTPPAAWCRGRCARWSLGS